jgi:hypothetical protein
MFLFEFARYFFVTPQLYHGTFHIDLLPNAPDIFTSFKPFMYTNSCQILLNLFVLLRGDRP